MLTNFGAFTRHYEHYLPLGEIDRQIGIPPENI